MRVADLFSEAKTELDALFGEGFSRANPLLVDRYVQQAFKARGKAIGHHLVEPSKYSYSYDFVSVISDSLSSECIAPGIPYSSKVDCAVFSEAVAKALGVENSQGFKASLGRFATQALGAIKRKRTVGVTRPWYYHFEDLITVSQMFSDFTGVEI